MCGIFGFQVKNSNNSLEKLTSTLLKISSIRGADASGISFKKNNIIEVLKKQINGDKLQKNSIYIEKIKNFEKADNNFSKNLIGQCRLATTGAIFNDDFNQPICFGGVSLVHNGIFLNVEDFSYSNTIDTKKLYDYSDTYLLTDIINNKKKEYKDYDALFEYLSKEIKGSYSLAFIDDVTENLYLSTNTGSLHYFCNKNLFIFSSEKSFITKCLKKNNIHFIETEIKQVFPKKYLIVNNCIIKDRVSIVKSNSKQINNFKINSVKNLKRCSVCILPETYPFIKFDQKGVCQYCNDESKFSLKKNLENILEKYRSNNSKNDCLVGLSGGRDSCYGLHLLKNEFGMNPIAYTYDWGLTTDISRRNQNLMIGKLGVEHIIRTADLNIKRDNIRKNIHAWMKRPELGMVPIFMSGDKDFYQYGRTLRRELNLDLTIFCSGHRHEQRSFFVGFCGVDSINASKTSRLYNYELVTKVKLAMYYCKQHIVNPRYINRSFFDSIKSFFSSFVFKDDFLYLYEYVKWNSDEIDKILDEKYGWEKDIKYGKHQWRMGDGQTAFTNFIYHHIAGFSEFDEFRSSQIREGVITRDEALKIVEEENQPKIETLYQFASTIGINLDETLSKIKLIEPIY